MSAPRIFLIHATPVAIEPINEAFGRLWPEAQLVNLLEDSLPKDLASAGTLTADLKLRFLALASYAVQAGADAILFTCSAFGEAIDLCKEAVNVPVLKPNEAMIEEALTTASRIAILATFEPAITSMSEEFKQTAKLMGKPLELVAYTDASAFKALQAGDESTHNEAIMNLAGKVDGSDIICFAQFSMTCAAEGSRASSALPVLTTPDSAVQKLRAALKA